MLLRNYQTEAVQSVYDAIIDGKKAPLIAMPTGTGKSLVLAHLVKRTCDEYPQTRHIILTHNVELIKQDAKAIRTLWPHAPVGVYSAGLNERDTMHPIIVGGCASVRNCVDRFGYRDFCVIDEAHLLSPTAETTYQKIIAKLREVNPNLIIVGLTATPYRRGIGCLTNGGIFDSIAIDLTNRESWGRFIAEGFLAPVYPKRTGASIDVSSVGISNGDFAEGQLQAASDKDVLNTAIAKEIATAARGRKATLVFCAGVEHAEHMATQLNAQDLRTRAVHSKLPTAERDAIISAFKSGRLDCVTNNNVLCLDEETEILTEGGFVGIDDMTPAHKIAAWKHNGAIEYTPPELIVRRRRADGEKMVRIGGDRGPQIRVTANHRMVVTCGRERSSLKVVAAAEMVAPIWWGIPAHGIGEPSVLSVKQPIYTEDIRREVAANSYNYRKNGMNARNTLMAAVGLAERRRAFRYKHPHELTTDECSLIGFWLGDGTKSGGRVAFAQSMAYADTIAWFDKLLGSTGLSHSRKIYKPSAKSTYESVRWTLARGTGGYGQFIEGGYFPYEPYFDKEGNGLLWGLDVKQLHALLHGFWMADGNHHTKGKNGARIAGTQLSLYEKLQAVCAARGINSIIRKLGPSRKEHHKQQYDFSWGGRDLWSIHGNNTIVEDWKEGISERVWCVTSSTSYLICKRRGKVFVTGNTTGFDYPAIDLIGMCRATVSVGLWVQMLGRGTRPSPGKSECIVLDFAGNRARLGPIDAPYVPKPKTGKETGEIPVKICDTCGAYAHISARVCECCGAAFPINTRLKQRAGDEAIMSTDAPVVETLSVSNVFYNSHTRKSDGAQTVRIDYMCGYKRYSKWINFEDKRQKHFAHEFWRQFVGDDSPENNEDALKLLNKGIAVRPKRVKVWTNKQWPEIMGFEL